MSHGISVREVATSNLPRVTESGIPFVVGTAPIQAAKHPAPVGIPVVCRSLAEARDKLGYSDDWTKYTLCEVMFTHFELYDAAPVIFCNLLDPADTDASKAADLDVVGKRITLPLEAINDSALVVKAQGGGEGPMTKGTDYAVMYTDSACIIEVVPTGKAKSAVQLNVAYNKVKPSSVTAATVATGFEAIEMCMSKNGIIPDLLLAPGFSHDKTVAAAMAVKAGSINGLFSAMALIDLDSTSATDYSAAIEAKNTAMMTDPHQYVMWPMGQLGGRKYHLSTHVAGIIANLDAAHNGAPVESPSNKRLKLDGICLADGTEVNLPHPEAEALDNAGIVAGFNFINGVTAWGSHTAAFPGLEDLKDTSVVQRRTLSWIARRLIKDFWPEIDRPLQRHRIENIIDRVNLWLNGLVGDGQLLGARVELAADADGNDLVDGKFTIGIYLAAPPPMKSGVFELNLDLNYIRTLGGK